MKSDFEDRINSLETQIDDLWFWLFLAIILIGFLGFKFYPQIQQSNPKQLADAAEIISTTPINFDGKFINPLPSKNISSGFGMRTHPITENKKMHWGLDWVAATGTPIKAIGSGEVVFADWNGGCGYEVKIKHNNQFESRYCHCSELLVKVGQKVNQGDVIAKVGSTGMSTGPHLHLEIHENGKPVNPKDYLP